MFVVIDSEFNRIHAPEKIGQQYECPPSYVQVRHVKSMTILDDGCLCEVTEKVCGNLADHVTGKQLLPGWQYFGVFTNSEQTILDLMSSGI